jgi:GNAT superfamily N-acetyltransferase
VKKFDFFIETFEKWYHDAEWMLQGHYEELSLDKDKVEMSLSIQRYLDLEQSGMLHVVSVRLSDGKMVGYYLAMILPHMHYQNAGPMAYTDMYYVHPDYRTGGIGARLMTFVEETLRQRGVVKVYITTKLKLDLSPMFEAMGWKATDKVFTKFLGVS